ncbi:hypothetical protein JIN85_00920 [Luteolibacter pohnpeiensis]|uniref:Uncharacterized protein n=1 Tax=Luteolibacter pohnpeiensis TaxID=454153 RepID=A0A934S8T9_9BACT|nr:hypothetical protein [Luteolibacter pohnpeiensis]MBK1880953.1 hypothetical protein [Luteolibacter pohnpeiensis]
MIPTPNQLFSRFERGEIERDELQAMMAIHARELIGEMEEDYRNPAAALMESLLARRAVGRLVRQHSGRLVREVLEALSEVEDFPPAKYLWNASHPDVPLHCYFRIRRAPMFRIVSLELEREKVLVATEYGSVAKGLATKRSFTLKRDVAWRLVVV